MAPDIVWLSLIVYVGMYKLLGYCDRHYRAHPERAGCYDYCDRPLLRPTVDLSIDADDLNAPETLPRGLVDLVNLFQGAPVTHLSITGEHGAPALDSAHWAAVFRAFPELEQLLLPLGGGRTKALWEGLLHASVTSTEAGGSVACRALRRVFLDVDAIFSVSEDLLETIVECLRVRAARGTRLQELYLYMFHDCDEEYEAMHATFMPQLKALVTQTVVFDHCNASLG
ncbi:hypothetical protein C8Q76DRAFT_752217 [Earliella scabrosa]|nr:hypothetical protein C8Q76DRAFT_752217 [Earliella scabrosa]